MAICVFRILIQQELKDGSDQVVLENYDDQDYGYLRIVVDSLQLRIEYHPQSDGAAAKTPDDSVTVNLKDHQLVHYQPIGTAGGAAQPTARTRRSASGRARS